MSNPELDHTDRRMIEILRAEGRISNLELAERINLSPTPCSRRLKRLEETGVITGYGARVDQRAHGLSVDAMVTVRLSRQTPEDAEAFLDAIESLPQITESLLVAGNLDYVLRVSVEDVDALREFILNGLKTLPGLAETTTMLILQASTKSAA
ncbi:MAG: Lrp/AsnC family transcriptional regulator [Pseudomonadota bacterium]